MKKLESAELKWVSKLSLLPQIEFYTPPIFCGLQTFQRQNSDLGQHPT